MQTEFYEQIQRVWNFYIKSVKKRRKAYLLDTTRGPVFVKSYDSPLKANWMVSLSEQLVNRGFYNTLEYYYTSDGLPYLSFNQKHYVAMKPIAGRDAQYHNLADISRTTTCLADFHKAATGIEGAPVLHTKSAPLIDKWEDRLLRFNNIINRMKKAKNLNTFERRILRFSPYIQQEAAYSLDLARRSPLTQEYSRALWARQVAHRDLASHNFLIGSSTYLIDYDTAVYDSHLVDLVQMVNRVLDQQSWSLDVFSRMLALYQQKVSLSDSQVALIYLLLQYPDNFMREIIGLYEGNAFVSQKVQAYISMIMSNWRQRSKFFHGSRHFFYEVSV